jgi:hypothetical protein
MENFVKNAKNTTGDKPLKKVKHPIVQDKRDKTRVKTVVPDNDGGVIWPDEKLKSSNKGQGPAGENL